MAQILWVFSPQHLRVHAWLVHHSKCRHYRTLKYVGRGKMILMERAFSWLYAKNKEEEVKKENEQENDANNSTTGFLCSTDANLSFGLWETACMHASLL